GSISDILTSPVDDWEGEIEAKHFEANSKSLGTLYRRAARNDDDGLGPFGLHKASAEPVLKKTPSEPELTGPLGLDDGHASASAGSASAPPVALITVTVSRKPTRAMYHVSDTTDVAFLIARLAREIRQAKQAQENEEACQTEKA
ncbi:unnamed protein product, partial [Durusdinium trenchii]